MIFEEVFADYMFDVSANCTIPNRDHRFQRASVYETGTFPSLLYVSRAIRKKALPIFIRLIKVFSSRNVSRETCTVLGAERKLLQSAAYAYLDSESTIDPGIDSLMPNLRELRIRMNPLLVGECSREPRCHQHTSLSFRST
jgi:hypothetical protein